MTLAASSTKSTSGRGKGKRTEQMTNVTTSLNGEFRCRPGRARQDESGAENQGSVSFRSLQLQDSAPGCRNGKGQHMGWYRFSNGTFCVVLECQT